MTLILPATARRARAVQRAHDVAEGGWWCIACHRDGHGRIAAAKCSPYLDAEVLLAAYARQRRSWGRASVPAGRVWSRD